MSKYTNHIMRRRHPVATAILLLLMVFLYGLSEVVKDKQIAHLLVRTNEAVIFFCIVAGLYFIIRDK